MEIQVKICGASNDAPESNQLKLLDIAEEIKETPNNPTQVSQKINQEIDQSQEKQRLEMH